MYSRSEAMRTSKTVQDNKQREESPMDAKKSNKKKRAPISIKESLEENRGSQSGSSACEVGNAESSTPETSKTGGGRRTKKGSECNHEGVQGFHMVGRKTFRKSEFLLLQLKNEESRKTSKCGGGHSPRGKKGRDKNHQNRLKRRIWIRRGDRQKSSVIGI